MQEDHRDEGFWNNFIGSGEVFEISGATGVGKTQLCMQACLYAQVPKIFGGFESESLFIDTCGDFSID